MLNLTEVFIPGFNIPFDICVEDQAGDITQPADLGYLPPSHIIETARSHRFKLAITFAAIVDGTSRPSRPLEFWPQKITRPTTEIDEITIHQGQDEIFRPGKHHHQPIEIDFYETLFSGDNFSFNDTARRLFEWWNEETLNYRDSSTNHPSILNNTVNVSQLDGRGADIWIYNLYRCWPQKVTGKDLDYTDSAICITTVRLRYDKVDQGFF